MIQVQIVIDLPPDGRPASVRVDRLAREDANEHEQLYANVFEDHLASMLREIAQLFKEEGWGVTFTGIGRSASAPPDEPPEQP